ncbi:MAG: hypothetical protein NTW26_02015, partial [bacterium]|nr:hypothetical protein [bacterium]
DKGFKPLALHPKVHFFIDSNLPYLPIYLAVKPRLYVATDSTDKEIVFISCDLSAGVHVDFSERFRLIIAYTLFYGGYDLPRFGTFGLVAQPTL